MRKTTRLAAKKSKKGPGHVVKTDAEGRKYDAWGFQGILDSRQSLESTEEIEYRVQWTDPWPATWQPALDLRDNVEEITEFHRRMPERPGPPGWVKEADEEATR